MTLTNRPGDTGDGTDPSGVRRPRPRLDRTPRTDADPRHEDGKSKARPRTRPVTSPAIVTDADILAADANFAAQLEAVGDAVPSSASSSTKPSKNPPPASKAPKVDLAALATAAVPVVETAKVADSPQDADEAPDELVKKPEIADGIAKPVAKISVVDDELPTSAVARTAATVAASPLPAEPVRGAGSATSVKRARSVVGRRRRPRVRRVRRVVRSIDTWTVFKVSTLFYLVFYAIVLVAGVLLWNLAYATGTIENIQDFFTDFGWETFEFEGGKIFHSAWIIGLFMVVAGVGMNVTLATVFNLISDLVGGIGVTVLEEEVRVVPQASPDSE